MLTVDERINSLIECLVSVVFLYFYRIVVALSRSQFGIVHFWRHSRLRFAPKKPKFRMNQSNHECSSVINIHHSTHPPNLTQHLMDLILDFPRKNSMDFYIRTCSRKVKDVWREQVAVGVM